MSNAGQVNAEKLEMGKCYSQLPTPFFRSTIYLGQYVGSQDIGIGQGREKSAIFVYNDEKSGTPRDYAVPHANGNTLFTEVPCEAGTADLARFAESRAKRVIEGVTGDAAEAYAVTPEGRRAAAARATAEANAWLAMSPGEQAEKEKNERRRLRARLGLTSPVDEAPLEEEYPDPVPNPPKRSWWPWGRAASATPAPAPNPAPPSRWWPWGRAASVAPAPQGRSSSGGRRKRHTIKKRRAMKKRRTMKKRHRRRYSRGKFSS